MDKFPLTKVGYEQLEQELKRRKGEDRPNIIAEIAEARGVPQGTVRRRIHDARKLLRRVLNERERD